MTRAAEGGLALITRALSALVVFGVVAAGCALPARAFLPETGRYQETSGRVAETQVVTDRAHGVSVEFGVAPIDGGFSATVLTVDENGELRSTPGDRPVLPSLVRPGATIRWADREAGDGCFLEARVERVEAGVAWLAVDGVCPKFGLRTRGYTVAWGLGRGIVAYQLPGDAGVLRFTRRPERP